MHSELYSGLAQAKPVSYGGRHFRSRSEAKWAVVLDHLSIPYYYEPSHYRLPSGIYLPDFWLPQMDAYLEVKPQNVVDQRYNELGEMRGKRVFLVSGNIPRIPEAPTEENVYAILEGHIWLKWPDDSPNYMLAREHQGRYNIVPIALASSASGYDPRVLHAYLCASTYEFERPASSAYPQ